jgi:SNF2 family DNA or RNA helicase
MNIVTLPPKTKPDMLGFKDLYESQQRGVDHLYEANQTQFVAPMGFGKTCVCLTAIGELITDKVIDCALVIAPKRVAQIVWPQEKEKWTHLKHLNVQVVDGGAADRLEKLANDDADVFVIGIDHIPWLCDYLKTLPDGHRIFDLLVIDELSRLKNPRGVWSKKMRNVTHRFKIRWGMTGTPRPNGLMDQYAPLAVLTANKAWGGSLFDRWRDNNFEALDYQRFRWVVRPEKVSALEQIIASYTVTVDMSDMPDLPPIVVRDHFIHLPDDVQEMYKAMEETLVTMIDTKPIVAANMGVATIKLAQTVQGFMYDEKRDTHWMHDKKFEMLEELVDDLDGDPVLVVYEFQEDLERMKQQWPDLRWLGHGVTDAQGRKNEKDWNDGKIPIFAIHPAAAGHGLNLQQGGNQMIWYGMTWSAELYDQTIARIHRQGQKDHCFIHRILAHDTIDEAKVYRVEHKISAQEAFKRYLRKV